MNCWVASASFFGWLFEYYLYVITLVALVSLVFIYCLM